MYEELEALRDSLAKVEGVKTCKIGLEQARSPADHPMIRLVPSTMTPGKPYNHRTVNLGIIFGCNLDDADGLENVYRALSRMEEDIIARLKVAGGIYLQTITDEDLAGPFKYMQIRCEIKAKRPDDPQT